MKCHICKRRFRQDDLVIPVMRYITNEKRGDFVGNMTNVFVHLSHIPKVADETMAGGN